MASPPWWFKKLRPRAMQFMESKGCEMTQNVAGIKAARQELTVIALGFECG